MDVRLAAFDVVVEIVAEQVDQVDCVVSHVLVRVPREQHCYTSLKRIIKELKTRG